MAVIAELPTVHGMNADDRKRASSLLLCINEGGGALHRSVEALAVQDARRTMLEPELQLLARGFEVLGKAAWVLHHQLDSTEEGHTRSVKGLGHRLVELFEQLDDRGGPLGLEPLVSGHLTLAVLRCCENFAKGGRFGNTDVLEDPGSRVGSPHLDWCDVQALTSRLWPNSLDQRGNYLLWRSAHVGVLQRLERALAQHIRYCQVELWGEVRVGRRWLDHVAGRPALDLVDPVPLPADLVQRGGNWRCSCVALEFGVWVYESSEGSPQPLLR